MKRSPTAGFSYRRASLLSVFVQLMSNNQSAGKGGTETDLHAAAWSRDIDRAKAELVSGIEVNVAGSIGETPLHCAAAWGRTEIVKFLLDQGADPTIKSNEGLTPLHWACSHGNKEVFSLLIWERRLA